MNRLVVRMDGVGSIKDLKTLCNSLGSKNYDAKVVDVDGQEATVEVVGKSYSFKGDIEAIEGEIIEEEED